MVLPTYNEIENIEAFFHHSPSVVRDAGAELVLESESQPPTGGS